MATEQARAYLGAHVGWRVVKAFKLEAKRRGKKPTWLVERVLSAVALDDLFKAVVMTKEDEQRDGE